MPQHLTSAVGLLVDSWDAIVTSVAGAPVFGLQKSTAKATMIVVAGAGTIFSAGVGFAMFLMTYSGLPDRVTALESHVQRVAQDVCVIRSRVEGVDAIRCFID